MSVMTTPTVHRSKAESELLAEVDRLISLTENHTAHFQAMIEAGDNDSIGKSEYGKGLLKATVMAYQDMAAKLIAARALHATIEGIYAPADDGEEDA